MPSRSGRSTAPSSDRLPPASRPDVYLLPAVVGGGLGDIEAVLAAGRVLARARFRTILYRRPGHAMPRSVDGPWDWPPVERRDRIRARSSAALTVSPAWGVSAGPSRPEPYGRGGPWELECSDIERAYGVDAVLHVSLEEFARTLRSVHEDRERLREGGIRRRALAQRLSESRRSGELAQLRTGFSRFRRFDRTNVLHLFATFRPDRGFAREYPEAVQTGPLWPRQFRTEAKRAPATSRREWVWYASPASAERLAADVVAGLTDARPRPRLYIRTDRPWTVRLPRDRVELARGPVRPTLWQRRFARADLRVVTGSRSLLEAIELGGPFLYFNGVLGEGSRRRRHRPEKIIALLDAARTAGISPRLRRDLADFARGRRVRSIVRAAAARADGWAEFPRGLGPVGFPPPYDDAGDLLVVVAEALGRAPQSAAAVVARVRAGSVL